MKKIFIAIMALAAPMAGWAFNGEAVINGLTYKIVTKSKKATIINNDAITIKGDLVIPATVTYKDEYEETVCNVVGIEDRAFSNQKLNSVYIPASVTFIGKSAFVGNKNLEEVIIDGNNLTSIGEAAFSTCRNLFSINLPESITVIPNSLFSNCQSLWDVNIPANVTEIGEMAFAFCAMSSVTIPDKVKTIGIGAFENCTNMQSLVIPASVTSLGTSVFAGTGLVDVTVPGNIQKIPDYAFHSCNKLKEVTISEGVTAMGENAFSVCPTLQKVTIPKSLKTVDSDAFRDCEALKEVHIADIASWCQIEFRFEESNPLALAHHLYRGVEVKDAVIPSGPTAIGKYAFCNSQGLLTTTIPNSVTAIGDYAYRSCTRLKRVVMGSGIKSIGGAAFRNCGDIEDVYCYATSVPTASSSTFADSYIEESTLHVPKAALSAYKNDAYWGKFGDIVAIAANDPIADMKECGKPTVSYKNGEIVLASSTPGADFVTHITPPSDFGVRTGSEVELSVKYTLTVYTTCKGYAPSDVTIVEINWLQTGDSEDDNITITGISPQTNQADTDADGTIRYYDLQGRGLNERPSKGMYIRNGKKYMTR